MKDLTIAPLSDQPQIGHALSEDGDRARPLVRDTAVDDGAFIGSAWCRRI